MQLKEIEVIKLKISKNIEKGDYITLSKILEIKRETALARYRRNNENTVLIMLKIIEEKQKLITKVKKYASNLCNAQ
jgi:hypothetical protein